MGRVDKIFAILVLLCIFLFSFFPGSFPVLLIELVTFFFGILVLIRLLRIAGRRTIWRLSNRLIVTYLFIAVVPVTLIITLAGFGLYTLTNQTAVYLMTSELDRRIESLNDAARSIAQTNRAARAGTLRGVYDLFYRDRFPGIEFLVRENGADIYYPEVGALENSASNWPEGSGIVVRSHRFYAWAHAKHDTVDVTTLAPLSHTYLAELVPNLGLAQFVEFDGKSARRPPPESSRVKLPPQMNLFDIPVQWMASVPVRLWSDPRQPAAALLIVQSRPSAVFNAIFSRRMDWWQTFLPALLLAFAILFLIVELIALVIGVTMTRNITHAVHNLYDGTRRVMEGNFAHRIEVKGQDQLAELGTSFNSMTENLERLVKVSKEKERLQSEIEIAREVQNQLYPKKAPAVKNLRMCAICNPARMVSGDYYDYELLRDQRVMLAIGDVAGKGISAALLMATLQSSLRAQLRSSAELAAAVGDSTPRPAYPALSTSKLVSLLNQQLYAYTSPEKYATFCFGIFDDRNSEFIYTNAGHLPPILIRDGASTRFEVNGTVVGAFAFSRYEESRVILKSGDLMVWFTDGVTEPENEYGEMFGEDRLVDLVIKNAHRDEEEIIAIVMESVTQWTGSPELQDDMTLLLARRE